MRLDKINALRQSLGAQQAAFTRPQTDRENITRASFVVSELIATKLKPHAEGEFVKECLVAAAELLTPDKVKLFQSVSLSRRTVLDRITDMVQDIEKTLQETLSIFLWLVMRQQTSQTQRSLPFLCVGLQPSLKRRRSCCLCKPCMALLKVRICSIKLLWP